MNSKKTLVRSRRNRKSTKLVLRLFLLIACIFLLILAGKLAIGKAAAALKQPKTDIENKVAASDKENIQVSKEKPDFKVCVDAGHGGYDAGTIGLAGIMEKNITLQIALKLGKILEKNNIEVIYTRNSDKVSWPSNEKEDLRERVKISNEAKADVFVSLHCNGNTNISYKGMEAWCRLPNTEGEKLAKAVQKELSDLNYTLSRGIKYEAEKSLAVLKLNNSVSTLIELGFLTNASDEKFIASEDGQDKCAEAIAKGILNYKKSYKN